MAKTGVKLDGAIGQKICNLAVVFAQKLSVLIQVIIIIINIDHSITIVMTHNEGIK